MRIVAIGVIGRRTSLAGILAALLGAAASFAAPPQNCGGPAGPQCPPTKLHPQPTLIEAANPSFGPSDTMVTIIGRGLSGITSVLFGGAAAGFTIQDDRTIIAYAPLAGVPGTTVPVTAITKDKEAVPTEATFSYPIGELDVTGPLPYDPSDIGDTPWYNGRGHSIRIASPGALMFGNPAPVFHVVTAFQDDSATHPPSYSPPFSLGNRGKFSATLQMCSLTGTPSGADEGGPCTNWDGNRGIWLNLTPKQEQTLDVAGPDLATFGDIALAARSAFDQANLARTFRLEVWLQQADTNTAAASKDRQEATFSNPFTAIVAPTAMVQLNALPYTIVYQPPGNQSTVTFSTTASYGASFSLGNSTETTNKTTHDQSGSTKFSISESYSGIGGSSGGTTNWDHASATSLVATHSSSSGGTATLSFTSGWNTPPDTNLVPGSGDTCGSPTNCPNSTLRHDPDIYTKEPFWNDTFVLLVHPQFAVWVDGAGKSRYVIYAAVPVTVDVTVAQLAACARGQTLLGQDACTVDYSDDSLKAGDGQAVVYTGSAHSLVLRQTEAQHLLELDPFYLAGQNAPLQATRAIAVASASYGAKVGQLPRPYVQMLSNQTQAQASDSDQKSSSTSIVDVIGSEETNGLTLAGTSSGISVSEGLTVTGGEKATFETDLKTTFSDSTAVSNQAATTAQLVLNDVDNTSTGNGGVICRVCHDPLPDEPSVNIYLDRLFGSFMFQDPRAPRAIPPLGTEQFRATLLRTLMHVEQTHRRFEDVSNQSPAAIAIGMLTRAHIVHGFKNPREPGRMSFQPGRPLTRAELATNLATALKLPLAQAGSGRFTDVSPKDADARAIGAVVQTGILHIPSGVKFGPNDPVSRQDFAAAIARGLKLNGGTAAKISDSKQIAPYALAGVRAVVAANFMTLDKSGNFRPTASVSRGDAAAALFEALKSQPGL